MVTSSIVIDKNTLNRCKKVLKHIVENIHKLQQFNNFFNIGSHNNKILRKEIQEHCCKNISESNYS